MGRECVHQPSEVVKAVVHVAGEVDARVTQVLEGLLHEREQPSGARNGQACESQLTEQLLPLLDGHAAFRVREAREELVEACDTVGIEFQSLLDDVDHPSQDDLPALPVFVALLELLLGRWFFACR
jgi:hypothetical protein